MPPLRFDPLRCNAGIELQSGLARSCARASSGVVQGAAATKWFTVLADHPGITSVRGSVLHFAVRVDSAAGGLAVGVVDPRKFRASAHNLGAAEFSWALSRSGKKSDGSAAAWQPYTERLLVENGTIIGCSVDLRPGVGTVTFWVNDCNLGVAFAGLDTQADLVVVPAVCLGGSSRRNSVVELVPWVPRADATDM